MWVPQISESNQPMYLSIADALARDIASGTLKRGERLPTLRELAAALDVTPGTISRAYIEASRRGLAQGEVGRGTYVLDRISDKAEERSVGKPVQRPLFTTANSPRAEELDLSIIKPYGETLQYWLRNALVELANASHLDQALDYTPDSGHPLHREAGAQWLRHWLPGAQWQQVVITSGAQHGLMVAISALTEAGDLVLCESLCYPGIISVAHGLGRRLRGVPMDEEGIIPEALREICQREKPAMLVCVATCQNPTTAIMSNARRAQIAALAEEFDFLLLDDDIYGFLATDADTRPLSTFAPDRSIYLTSLSKSVLPALRIGYLYSPPKLLSRLTSMVRSTVWMPSPLTAQLASHVIGEGLDSQLIRMHRAEAAARQAIASEVFGAGALRSQPHGYHVWLNLPEQWRSDEFALLARANGVIVMSGSQFQVERSGDPRGVRVVLMSPTSQEELRFALTQLASLLESGDPKRFY
ncbi:PLP-dependent aminotransferase family protein [Pseudomonas entomophila]|uniref:PLP-dependent aminotransferase family protein n=2 Tax=Pseudomonas entomophila TaxID=312306 RepID=A0ABY9QX91_9PSED|nr:PLP-dependent aminotransferase family protein [Pseudomonas entomophila]WMW07680.1 PLP-dependent aminotransferase family protein [Pseudomonas entomophila]CAK16573.1 putative transcriptional regulator, GntR family [Pseudomonas entomophila L48]